MNWKRKVRISGKRDASKRKAVAETMPWNYWMHRAVKFSRPWGLRWMVLTAHQERKVWQLFDMLPFANRVETRYAFFQLIACLLRHPIQPIRLPRNPNAYTKGRYNNVGPIIIEIMDTLHELKYIGMRPGFKDGKIKRQSRVWALDTLMTACPLKPLEIISAPLEVIIKKGPKDENGNRQVVDYPDTRQTLKVRKKLNMINSVNTDQENEILYLNRRLFPFLRASFIERWTWDGRLYTSGKNHLQGMSGDERVEITINGEPVAEVDFSGMHPRLLYAWEDLQYDADPYTAVTTDTDIRSFLKIILLCMINESTETGAVRAANDWLHHFPRKDSDGNYYQPGMTVDHRAFRNTLEQKGITSAAGLVEQFMDEHQAIAKYLCSDLPTGYQLRNADAGIALEVCYHFASKGIPCLPIHDSFIVQNQYGHKLAEVMEAEYRKQSKGFWCPVKIASVQPFGVAKNA